MNGALHPTQNIFRRNFWRMDHCVNSEMYYLGWPNPDAAMGLLCNLSALLQYIPGRHYVIRVAPLCASRLFAANK